MDVRSLRDGEVAPLHDDCWLPFAFEMQELDAHDALDDPTVGDAAAVAADTLDDPARFAGYAFAELGESPPVFARGDPVAVLELYVRPEYRGDGLAHDLLDAVEAWGRERGRHRAELHVHARNDAAKGLYESRDYETFMQKRRKPL
jgi:GNAT superfamily N-acetyltransferase